MARAASAAQCGEVGPVGAVRSWVRPTVSICIGPAAARLDCGDDKSGAPLSLLLAVVVVFAVVSVVMALYRMFVLSFCGVGSGYALF